LPTNAIVGFATPGAIGMATERFSGVPTDGFRHGRMRRPANPQRLRTDDWRDGRPTMTFGGRRVRLMPTFVLRLMAPRPNFAQTITDAEREIMNRHAAHWRPYLERGDMVVFGPILTDVDSNGLAVVETEDEQALREFAALDPVVTTGTAAFEFGRLAAGHVSER
jgi:hypothetical protein